MIGQKLGSWEVLEEVGKSKDGHLLYTCKCSCGNISKVTGSKLRQGVSSKCKTCTNKENFKKATYASGGVHLYFIKCGSYIKIGTTNNIDKRLANLQSSNPEKLEIIYYGENEGYEEEMWHKVFNHRHERGEWFNFK